jgi:glycosyltransferase involved in cell wall biosynthesis
MKRWHIVTSEYPPDIGGVSDYTWQVAEALASEGDEVHVWCPPTSQPRSASSVRIHTELGRFRPSDLRRLADSLDMFAPPRRLLVQWVPHGFGYRSMNLWFCVWLAIRALKGDIVELMVHEPFLDFKAGRIHHRAIAVIHRVMTIVLLRSASKVWVAIPAWESLLRPYAAGRRLCIDWLPIPGCVTAQRTPRQSVRSAYVDAAQPLVGHFGSYGDEVSSLLAERLPALMDSDPRPSLLLIGARSEAFRGALIAKHPSWRARIHATGYVDPADLSRYLEACDLFLQPYPDGITSRRTSSMACLSLGLPILTTCGHLTESLWETSGAVALVDVADAVGFSAAATQLLQESSERQRLASGALRLYRERFTVSSVVTALRAA